jgi:hypothetical protein
MWLDSYVTALCVGLWVDMREVLLRAWEMDVSNLLPRQMVATLQVVRGMLNATEQLKYCLATTRKLSVCFFNRYPENPRDVPADAGFLCGKAAVFGEEVQETPRTIRSVHTLA